MYIEERFTCASGENVALLIPGPKFFFDFTFLYEATELKEKKNFYIHLNIFLMFY